MVQGTSEVIFFGAIFWCAVQIADVFRPEHEMRTWAVDKPFTVYVRLPEGYVKVLMTSMEEENYERLWWLNVPDNR